MKSDNNPSILFLGYSKPEKKQEAIKQIKEKGLEVREVYLLDVSVPLNKDYDETINWFKHFIKCDYWAGRSPLNWNFPFLSTILNKLPYKPIKFKKKDWENDNKHPLLYSLLCPLMYQDISKQLTTKQEKKNLNNLSNFKSKGYKPNLKGVYSNDDFIKDLARFKNG